MKQSLPTQPSDSTLVVLRSGEELLRSHVLYQSSGGKGMFVSSFTLTWPLRGYLYQAYPCIPVC